MMRNYLLLSCSLLITGLINAQNYPQTKKEQVTDVYFGTQVSDPYRWLEDDRSAETKEWVKRQNKTTEEYLSKIPYRDSVKARMKELWNYPKMSVPFRTKDNYFVYTNDGLQNQFVLNILRTGPSSKPEPFLDPNSLSEDGTVNIGGVSVSKDGRYMAFSTSKAGSDWNEIRVKNVVNGNLSGDLVKWVKFSGIAWHKDGFFYSRYDEPDSAQLLKGKNEFHKVYYHTLGNPQKYDVLVYHDKENPLRNFYAGTTEDERFLILAGSQGTSGNNLMVKDLSLENSDWITIVDHFNSDYDVIDNDSTRLLILTNNGAPRYQLISVDVRNPNETPKVIIPESEDVLQYVYPAHNFLVAKCMKDARTVLKIFTRSGKFVTNIPLATIGTVDQLSASKKDELLFYSLTSFTSPSTIYQYNLRTKVQTEYFAPKINFDFSAYDTKQVFYPGKDGTKIPMFIVHKKGIQLDGSNPVLLYGYGGFNLPQTPSFKIERLVFLERGGIFALANIRGGGEYGEEWHKAGTKLRKQNVFDDFIAAAEYLISEKYTSPEKIGIQGRSNGGLLVGAVMTQRPDLFKVALPAVGVLDMLRYHKFTIGWAWKGDYGSSENEDEFRYLLGYSPLHTLKPGVQYPATLVTTGDHDDRVVPAHSFKFIAQLQEVQSGNNPVLIRVDIDAGHASSTALGSSKPVAKQIDEHTDVFSFLMYYLGM
ncbi:MAG: S9 family peptidase [Bacteroidetes bacterium]|nr:MAG: S9 family peptidase [Bacteroidota bacterium]